MKRPKTDKRIEESLLQLLLPVSRLLVQGGVGIDELIRAAKGAYLRAAMQAVGPQDGRVNISRLSVATGMTRKQVSALLNDAASNGERIARRSGQQRALRVISGWLTDPRFHKRDGRPDELTYRGNKKSFTLLVKLYGGDVTPKSVLRELQRIEIVDLKETGVLKLRALRSRAAMEIHYKVSELARLFEDFALAAIGSSPNDALSFFAFKDSGVTSESDAAYVMRRFSGRAAAFLEDFQRWSEGRERTRPLSHQQDEAIRVGLGVYLVRSDQRASSLAGANTTPPGKVTRSRKGRR